MEMGTLTESSFPPLSNNGSGLIGIGDGTTLSSSSSSSSSGLLQSSPTASSSSLATDVIMDPQRFPLYLRITATSICVLLLMIGCLGNILVPLVVLKTKDLRNSTNIFLMNLSIADLLILLISSPTVLIELHTQPETWYLGLFMCKAVSFVEILVAHGSILTILAISFERYYAICRPLEAGYKCTKKRAFHVIVIIWMVATVSTVPMLAITELHMTEYIDGTVVPVCSNSLQQGWHPMYFIFIIFTFFCVPFLILVVLYVLITKKLTSESRGLSLTTSNSHRTKVRRQVVMMLASVCITFFVCLLPFRLMTLWIIFSTHEDIINLGAGWFYNLLFTCRILLYVNSSINPILYNLISSKFRAAFRGILGRDTSSMSMSRSNEHSILSERISASNFTNNNCSIRANNNSVNNNCFNNTLIVPTRNGTIPTSPNHYNHVKSCKNTLVIISKGTQLLETTVDVHAL